MDSLFPQLLSNFILQKASLKYGFQTNEIYMISPILAGILARILLWDFDIRYIMVFPLSGVLYWYYIEKYRKRKDPDEYISGVFYDNEVMEFIFYNANKNPDFTLDNMYNIEKIDGKISSTYINFWLPQLSEKVHFVHKDVVEGYFEFYEKIEKNDEKEHKYRYMVLSLKKKYNISIVGYCDILEKWKRKKDAEDKIITLQYKKISKNIVDLDTVMYNEVSTVDARYTQFMRSYFSDNRELIWNIVSHVQNEPKKFYNLGQVPRANILLHGPPGTGKSSLVYRLALCLGRNILNIDLASYLNIPKKLEPILRNPIGKPKDNIILFEEIDVALKYIKEQSTSEKKKIESEKNQVEEKSLQVEDLLEIFQGAVPISDSIIIGTTNNIEYIRELCPALIRPGRLTPIYCGYMNWKNLQEMTQYYFGRELELPEVKITTSTAELTETCIHLALNDKEKGFYAFQEYIRTKLSI